MLINMSPLGESGYRRESLMINGSFSHRKLPDSPAMSDKSGRFEVLETTFRNM